MATRKQSATASPIRMLFSVGSIGNLTDGQLLERFATGRGEPAELAFAALVERHGPMVLRVCRSVLADSHDAEDAFQATFLVLVKKARGLWVNDSLGAWLHQVAFRTASSALKDTIRRQRHERRAAELAATTSAGDEGARHEMENLLHAEIERLPDRYRVPIVLCDLEGRSYDQAARHLGWPVGTVKSRLARGRDRLRDRLQRRGIVSGTEFVAFALRPGGANHVVPAALVQATTTAAVRFGASQTIASVSAAALAQGVLSAMSMTRWIKVASVLLIAAATVSGGGLMSRMAASGNAPGAQKTAQAKASSDVPVAEVKRGPFRLSVNGPGSLEAVRRAALLCKVEGRTTIIAILPEGAKVKKGDFVCELDSASLRDQLTNQKITTQGEEVSYLNAKLARENAAIALKEYEEGAYPLERVGLEGEVKLADSAIQKARAQLERTRRFQEQIKQASRKDPVTESNTLLAKLNLENQVDAADQSVMREQLARQQAEGKLRLLEKFTLPRTIQELKSRVVDRESVEQSRKRSYQLSLGKERSLERQIENCKLLASSDGVIVYANNSSGQSGAPQIEEGATVRERQIILWVVDLDGPMQVNAKMPESMVDREQVGQKVLIGVDAFPGQAFWGKVVDIAPLPDPSFLNKSTKVYTTHILLDEASRKLRPGMSAKVAIFLAERESALTVPPSAVIQLDGKDRVAVKKAEGGFEWRDVTVGEANGSQFEVTKGIRPGEQVAAEPMELLSAEERARAAPAVTAYIKKTMADRKTMRERPLGKTSRVPPLSLEIRQKARNLSPEDRAKLKGASQQERTGILKKAGFTEAELREIEERRKQVRGPN